MSTEITLSSNDEALATFLGALIGVVGGFFLISLFENNKPKCPVCGDSLEQGISVCPHCGAVLQWT